MATNMSAEPVQIKGTSSGLVITLPDGDFDVVLAQVDELSLIHI